MRQKTDLTPAVFIRGDGRAVWEREKEGERGKRDRGWRKEEERRRRNTSKHKQTPTLWPIKYFFKGKKERKKREKKTPTLSPATNKHEQNTKNTYKTRTKHEQNTNKHAHLPYKALPQTQIIYTWKSPTPPTHPRHR